nr:MAG TPA: hypothetical protein [Caudoviricetes sp.]
MTCRIFYSQMLKYAVNHNIFLFLFGAYHINYYLCHINKR